MAQIKISALTTGTPKGTDLTPATDTTDTTQAASGTTKKYIRSDELNFYLHSIGLITYSATRVATTIALTAIYANGALGVGATLTNSGAQTALSIDGVALSINDRVLVKNQASTFQNGIYIVTNIGSVASNWIMIRATDYDQAAEVIQYGVMLVDQGTLNAGLLYQETAAGPFVIGTSPITFALFTTQSLSLPVLLSQGGTSASLTANNGGIFYSNATTGAILSGTATANQILLSGSNSAPSWSTAVYPATTTINEILFSSSNNIIGSIISVVGGVLISSNTSVPSFLANPTATGRFLQSVSGAAPIWSTASFPIAAGAAGTILRSNGTDWIASTATFADTYGASVLLYSNGANTVTGLATANNGLLVTGNTGIPSILAGPGTTGNVLQSNAALAPSFSTATYPSVATSTGTILRADGTNWVHSTATFADTYSASNLLYSNGINAVTGLTTANSASLVTTNAGVPVWSATMTNGQLIIGSTGATPVAANLTAGTGISITNAAGSITISASTSGLGWSTISGTTQAADVNNGYIVGNAGQTTITLPAVFAIGDVVIIKGLGAAGWILAANTGDIIQLGQTATSAGGTLTSAGNFDTVYVTGLVANTTWSVDYVFSTGLTVA